MENGNLQRAGLKALTPLLSHSRVAVRKRTTSALSSLAANASSDVFTQLSTTISVDLSEGGDIEKTKTVVQLVGALIRTCPRRLGRRLPDFAPRIFQTFAQDDDELRESSLQTLELVLLRCPVEITPFLNQIVDIAIGLIKHDPNYAAGNDSDEEMAEEFDGFDDDDDDLGVEEDYSDDDDVSWKVRRAAAKTLNAAIITRPELLAPFVTGVAPILVARFSEREESVRIEVLHTFLALLKQVQLSAGLPQATEVRAQSPGALKRKRDLKDVDEATSNPLASLRSLVPAISKALLKELPSKSSSTRLLATTILKELAHVLKGGLDANIPSIVAQLDKSIKTAESSTGAGSALTAEIITLLRIIFATHTSKAYAGQLNVAVPILANTITSKVHRDSLEALDAAADLTTSLYAQEDPTVTDSFAQYLNELYGATVARLGRQDSDQEIKERCIATLGILMASAADDLQGKQSECLSILLDRLSNEVTRNATVKVVGQIAKSNRSAETAFDDFLQSTALQVSALIRQSNRVLKLAAFDALAATVDRLKGRLTSSTASNIVTEIQVLLAQDIDVSLLPYALKIVGQLVVAKPELLSAVQEAIMPRVLDLIKSPLLQGVALEAVVAFIEIVVTVEPQRGGDVIQQLNAAFEGGAIAGTVARCIGATLVSKASNLSAVVDDFSKKLQVGKKDEAHSTFNLFVLGELGRIEDFNKHSHILEQILSHFESPSEEVRAAAAFALGNMAVGNFSTFMPVIRQQIESEGKQRLLALSALKELITHGSTEQLSQVADQIWSPLFDICQIKDDATRNVGAECLARLTLTDPPRYLVQLQSRLADPSPSTRAAVIAAVRFTLTEASSGYDELLSPMIVEFLSLLKDQDLDVRRHTMFALNSAAHNKPHLIRDQLNMLLPLLYEETHVRKELMRKVAMGPFTVVQDDGLDLRKNAFETMYTLLDACLSQINVPEYLSRVVAGLRDDDQVKLLCYLILVRLTDLVPVQVAQALDEISEPIGESLKVKLKDGATKQDVEKSTELTRAAFRALVALQRCSATQGIGGSRFRQLILEASTGPSAGLFAEVEAAASSQRM